METPAVLLLCMLVTCSVWEAYGRISEGEKKAAHELEVKPKCVACKLALMKVRDCSQPNESRKSLKSKLYVACTELEDLCAVCKRFVKKHLRELIKALKTQADVKMTCINAKACKPDLTMRKF